MGFYRRSIALFLLVLLSALIRGTFFVASRSTTPQDEDPALHGLTPLAEFNSNGALSGGFAEPATRDKAIEQALANAWQWAPDTDRNRPDWRDVQTKNGMIAYEQMPEQDLYLTDPPGTLMYGLATDLPNHYSFEWSPDEQLLVFVGIEPEIQEPCLHKLDPETRRLTTLTCGFADIWEPRWSPDGARVAFYGRINEDDTPGSWVVSSSGGSPIRLAPGLQLVAWPSWLDDDTVLVAARPESRAYAIYRVDVDQPETPRAITPMFDPQGCDGTFAIYPEVSPDAQWVAFAAAHSTGGKSSGCYAGIYVVDPEGTTAPALKGDISSTGDTGHARYGRLRWNPNNSSVGIMGSGSNNVLRLYVVDVSAQSDNVKELKNLQSGVFSLWDWSPDGQKMVSGHMPDDGDWSLYIIDPATDSFNPIRIGLDPAWSSRPPDDPVDLIATRLEVTQAVQDDDNSVPLVEGKATWIRLYVRSVGADVEQVSAQLRLTRDGNTSIILPVNPRLTVTTAGSSSAQVEQTFNFLLPLDQTRGTITISAEVGPESEFPENDYTNNHMPRLDQAPVQLQFGKTDQITIDAYRFRFRMPGDTEYVAELGEGQALMPYVQWVYPLAENGLSPLVDKGEIPIESSEVNLATSEGWLTLLGKLNAKCGASGNNRCVGLLPDEVQPVPNDFWGYAVRPGAILSVGMANRDLRGLVAHELGHTYGLGHTGCDRISDYGFHDRQVFPPSSYYSLMNPRTSCGMLTASQWVTTAHYRALQDRLRSDPAAREVNVDQVTHLVIVGVIEPGQWGSLEAVYEVTKASNSGDQPEQGPYTIDLYDINSQLLLTHAFDGSSPDGESPATHTGFVEAIPRPADLARIVLRQGATILDEMLASGNAPQVSIQTTLEGQTLTTPTPIAWDAYDVDGDALSYVVEYSADAGQTWEVLAVDLQAATMVLDPTYLAGTHDGKIRVRATDGLNTGESVSEGLFAVPKHPPIVSIIDPRPGPNASWNTLSLVASAYDREDGLLPDEAFAWYVDDQLVAEGPLDSVGGLGYGEHTIRVEVTDSDRQVSVSAVNIVITDFPMQLFLPMATRN